MGVTVGCVLSFVEREKLGISWLLRWLLWLFVASTKRKLKDKSCFVVFCLLLNHYYFFFSFWFPLFFSIKALGIFYFFSTLSLVQNIGKGILFKHIFFILKNKI